MADTPATPAKFAELALARLREHFPQHADDPAQHLLKLVGETGELAEAYMRSAGRSRRPGTLAEVEAEAADVLLTLHVYALSTGIALRSPAPFITPGFLLPADALLRLAARVGQLVNAPWREHEAAACAVLAAVHDAALSLGIDLDSAWKAKAAVIAARPWKESADAR